MRGSEHREHLARFEVKSMCRRQGRWSSVIFRGERERPCAPRTSARLLLQRPSHTKPTKTTDPALLPLTSTNYNTLRSEGKGWTRRRVGARRLVWSSLPPLPRRFPPPSPLFSPPVPTLFPPCPHPFPPLSPPRPENRHARFPSLWGGEVIGTYLYFAYSMELCQSSRLSEETEACGDTAGAIHPQCFSPGLTYLTTGHYSCMPSCDAAFLLLRLAVVRNGSW